MDGADRDASLLQDWGAAYLAVTRSTAAMFAAVTRQTGLPRSQAEVLLRLALKPGVHVTMSELAEVSGYTAGGMSKLADKLARAGLVERVAQPGDRRVVRLALTSQGRETVRAVEHLAADHVRTSVITRLGTVDFNSFIALAGALPGAPRR